MRKPLPLDRIEAIDALRGFAMLGVLIVNLEMTFRTTMLEQAFPGETVNAFDPVVRSIITFLLEGKSIAIFSILFGTGLAMQIDFLRARGREASLLFRRLMILLGFGLLHLTLWSGDILSVYAVAGLFLLPVLLSRRINLIVAMAVAIGIYIALAYFPLPSPAHGPEWFINHVTEARRIFADGSFAEITRFRWAELPLVQMSNLHLLPRTAALILFGAWVWRKGWLVEGQAADVVVGRTAWLCLPLGLILTLVAGHGVPQLVEMPHPLGRIASEIASPVLALGYAASFLLLFRKIRLGGTALVAFGRMAFTNYLSQTVILVLVFYGYGLGLTAKISAASGLLVALTIIVGQMLWSRWWLARYRFGPLEWLWRSGMYGTWQSFKR